MSPEILKLYSAATRLAEDLASDIGQCKTREEHVRVTARANAASAIVEQLNKLSATARPDGD